MRPRNAVLIFSAILTLVFNASPVFSQDKASLLQERCDNYYRNFAEGRYGNMWDMSVWEIQNSTPREEYVAYFKEFFDNYLNLSISSGYDRCAKLLEDREDIAVSKVFISLKNAKESIYGCNLLIFSWRDDNWYFSNALSCEYENDVSEIMKDSE